MGYEVKVIEYSLNPYNGIELITLQLRFPRFILAEMNTHRTFSRNASSTRAIPTKKLIKQILDNPVTPEIYGSNKPGMQSGDELIGWRLWAAKKVWLLAGKFACGFASLLTKIGLHKQWAGRIVEPWMWTSVVLSSTEWNNFFNLRCHKDAQPEIFVIACMMKQAIENSVGVKQLCHLPYVSSEERNTLSNSDCVKVSIARCARVSYLTHDGSSPQIEDDIKLCTRLVGSVPIHASPAEHQAWAFKANVFEKNFRGWRQARTEIEKTSYIMPAK